MAPETISEEELDFIMEQVEALPVISGDDMERVQIDVANGTAPDSTYSADMREHHEFMVREWRRLQDRHPRDDAVMWIPSELPKPENIRLPEPASTLPKEETS